MAGERKGGGEGAWWKVGEEGCRGGWTWRGAVKGKVQRRRRKAAMVENLML